MFVLEIVCTFIFVNMILNLKNNNGSTQILNGFAISSTLIGMIYNAGGISGACFNPAVAIVQTIFQNMVLEGSPA